MYLYIGTEPEIVDLFSGSLEDPYFLGIYSQKQALNFIGNKIKQARAKNVNMKQFNKKNTTPETDAMEMLAQGVLNHVPVHNFCFNSKIVYITHIVRRVLKTVNDRTLLDDKDYYGNKRLELAGSLLALLFEDLFKKFNHDIKENAEKHLSKVRVDTFDVIKFLRPDEITRGILCNI